MMSLRILVRSLVLREASWSAAVPVDLAVRLVGHAGVGGLEQRGASVDGGAPATTAVREARAFLARFAALLEISTAFSAA